MRVERRPTDLAKRAASAEETTIPSVEEVASPLDAALRVACHDHDWRTVAVEGRTQQVLVRILLHAIQAMPPGGTSLGLPASHSIVGRLDGGSGFTVRLP